MFCAFPVNLRPGTTVSHHPQLLLQIFSSFSSFSGTCIRVSAAVRGFDNCIDWSACADQVLHISKQDDEKKLKELLQNLFTKLMSVNEATIADVISKLIIRLSRKHEMRHGSKSST